jgi:hypothetical protein
MAKAEPKRKEQILRAQHRKSRQKLFKTLDEPKPKVREVFPQITVAAAAVVVYTRYFDFFGERVQIRVERRLERDRVVGETGWQQAIRETVGHATHAGDRRLNQLAHTVLDQGRNGVLQCSVYDLKFSDGQCEVLQGE